MAFESEIRDIERKKGPKLFTEYMTEALVALICQIGIAVVSISLLTIAGIVIPVLGLILPISAPVIGILYLAVGLLGLYQAYVGWKMHQGEVEVQKCVQVDMVSVALAAIVMISMAAIYPLLLLLGAQILIAVIVVDIIAIVLLRDERVVAEFEWWKTSDPHSEYRGNY